MPKRASKHSIRQRSGLSGEAGHTAKRSVRLAPYLDVAIFMATLLLANLFWKWMIRGDGGEPSPADGVAQSVVTCFGLDVTALFDAYARHIASVVYAVVHYFRDSLYMVNEITMRFPEGGGTAIVWSCTPLKQMFIWVCLMLTTPTSFSAAVFQCSGVSESPERPVKRSFSAAVLSKLWFIPLGLVFIHLINLARICAITAFMEFHPEWFELLHTYIFKYLFYGLMFLFWVLYVEKVRK